MDKVTVIAPAKINLSLDILGVDERGYHLLDMIMQTVSLFERVTVSKKEKDITLSSNARYIPTDSKNVAVKAAMLFFEYTGIQGGVHIHIKKTVPIKAGMAGGSADAAAVLRALNKHYGNPLSILALAEIGAEVGSDVPFCVLCGTAMVEGRGERLRKLPDLPDCFFVVCKPDFSSSTPELYRKLDETVIARRPDNQAMESALLAGDLQKIAENVWNVFDPVVTQEHLELNYIKSIFNSYGAIAFQMTGSGSAVYAIVTEFEHAAVICNMLKDNYPQVYIAKPI